MGSASWLLICAQVIALASCGGGNHTQVSLNVMAAEDSVAQLGKLGLAMDAMNGNDGLVAALKLTSAHEAIFEQRPPNDCPHGADLTAPFTRISASCTTTSCELSYRKAEAPFNDQLDGTTRRDGDAFEFTFQGNHYHSPGTGGTSCDNDGTLMVSATSVTGSVRIHAQEPRSYVGEPPTSVSNSTIAYRAIELDANGCPIGGTIHAVRESESSDDELTESIEGSLTFGPSCGDVR